MFRRKTWNLRILQPWTGPDVLYWVVNKKNSGAYFRKSVRIPFSPVFRSNVISSYHNYYAVSIVFTIKPIFWWSTSRIVNQMKVRTSLDHAQVAPSNPHAFKQFLNLITEVLLFTEITDCDANRMLTLYHFNECWWGGQDKFYATTCVVLTSNKKWHWRRHYSASW